MILVIIAFINTPAPRVGNTNRISSLITRREVKVSINHVKKENEIHWKRKMHRCLSVAVFFYVETQQYTGAGECTEVCCVRQECEGVSWLSLALLYIGKCSV